MPRLAAVASAMRQQQTPAPLKGAKLRPQVCTCLQPLTNQLRRSFMNTKFQLAFALLVGVGIGAVAVQSLYAQAKPPAFNIAEITVTNNDGYTKEYLPPVLKSIQEFGGKFIVRGGKTISGLGTPPAPRITVIQFESLDKAQAWANSPANMAAQAIGDKYATFRTYQVEGVAP
jgi:uncharacterized protein (DUF1330 family)